MDDSESDSDDFGVRKPPAHELTSDQMKEAKHALDQIRVPGTAAVRMIKSDTLGDTAAWVELDEDSCVAWATSHAEHKSAVTQLDTSLGYGRGETSRCNTRTLVAGDYVRAENQADEWKTVPEIVNGQACIDGKQRVVLSTTCVTAHYATSPRLHAKDGSAQGQTKVGTTMRNVNTRLDVLFDAIKMEINAKHSAWQNVIVVVVVTDIDNVYASPRHRGALSTDPRTTSSTRSIHT